MAKEKIQKDGERLEQIESTLGKTEMFIEKNRKPLIIAVAAVIVVILAVVGWNKLVSEPREHEAEDAIYASQQLMMDNAYTQALNGDETSNGLLYVIDEFGGTKSGNLARYYAGVCYLHLGEYENAIKYFDEFDGEDMFMKPLAMGMKGDAYLELENISEAAQCYEKAGKDTKNKLTSPYFLLRAGYVYEMEGKYEKALEMYNIIKDEYPKSNEGLHIIKNIAAVEAMAEK